MKCKACVTFCILVLFSEKALAFTADIHEHICQVLFPIIVKTADEKTFSFGERSIFAIRQANRKTDTGMNIFSNSLASYKHFDGEEFSKASEHLINMKKDAISKITAYNPNGQKARESLGTALHTLQDFYAHSNWVEIGNTGINVVLGWEKMTNPPATTAFCPDNREVLRGAGLTELTSGYFVTDFFPVLNIGCGKTPKGKCNRGFKIFNCGGINKDDLSRDGYESAYLLAFDATYDYIKQILDASGVTGNAKALKALMGSNGTLGLVIDDTASMGEELDQIKAEVKKIVENYEGKETEPDEYLLVSFGDPDFSDPYTTTDASSYLSKINTLYPHDGDDCPELSQSGLIMAISAIRNDSNLYLFTDADAKDKYLAHTVSATAQAKRIKITAFLTDSCSPAYYKNTEETGGQLFILKPDDLDKVFDLVRPQLSGDLVTISRTKGSFNSNRSYAVA